MFVFEFAFAEEINIRITQEMVGKNRCPRNFCIISKVGRFSDRNLDLNSNMIEMGDDIGIFSGILVEKQLNLLILLFVGFFKFCRCQNYFSILKPVILMSFSSRITSEFSKTLKKIY